MPRRGTPSTPKPPDKIQITDLPAEATRIVIRLWLLQLLHGGANDHRGTYSYDLAREQPDDGRPSVEERSAVAAQCAFLQQAGWVRKAESWSAVVQLTAAGEKALPALLRRRWSEEGIRLADAQVVEEIRPVEVVAALARFVGKASGLQLGANGRPGTRAQDTLRRLLPVSRLDTHWARPQPAGPTPRPLWTATPWAGYHPRVAPFAAIAAFLGLLESGPSGWSMGNVDAWELAPVSFQWKAMVDAWLRTVAACGIGPVALAAATDAWVSPERLVAWATNICFEAEKFKGFLTTVVAAGAVGLGVASLGQVGDVPVFRLTEAGRAVLVGADPLIVDPHEQEPLRVLPDFTVLQSADSTPSDASWLSRIADIERVERVVAGRLTQRAWTAALEAGIEAEEAIAYLREASEDTLPQNVAYTLEHDWSGSRRTASLEPVLLLRLPTAEVAARAEAHRGLRQLRLEALTPTLWAMPPDREDAVRKALVAAGLRDLNAVSTREMPVDADAFRLGWPGPFGSPQGQVQTLPTPAAVVHMPPKALYRRLWLAYKNGTSVWIEVVEEGIVHFHPTAVSHSLVTGHCDGCGRIHTFTMDEVRGMLDAEAIENRR